MSIDPEKFGDTDAMALCVVARGYRNPSTHKECEGLPVMIHGDPGSGKSAIAAHIADRMKRPAYVIPLAAHDPTDIGGLPVPDRAEVMIDEKSGVMKFHKAVWSVLVDCKNNNGVLILDDITTAPKAVQSAALQLVLERQLGELTLENVPIILTGNFDSRTVTSVLTPAMANRMVHLYFQKGPESDAYKYRTSGKISQLHLPLDMAKDLWKDDVWNAHLQVAEALVAEHLEKGMGTTAYEWEAEGEGDKRSGGAGVRAGKGRRSSVPIISVGDDPLKYAYPTDRTYEYLERILATADYYGVSGSGLRRLIVGCIGERQGKEIYEKINGKKRPSMQDVLEGRVNFADYGPAQVVTVLRACANAITDKNYDKLDSAIRKFFKECPQGRASIKPSFKVLEQRMEMTSDDPSGKSLPTSLANKLIELRKFVGGGQGLGID